MKTQIELKKEIHSFIDIIPYQRLQALKPLLADLARSDFVIETNLTDEEHALIAEGMREYAENPSSFISLEDYKKTRGIA
jgi:hypothetical protein